MRKGVDHIGVSVVYFCHDGAGSVVMQRRSASARDENHCWDIGGGAIEFGTSAIETLAAEIKEEYCAQVQEYTFLGYRDVLRGEGDATTHWLALDFLVRLDPAEVANGEPHKFDEVRWFPIADMPDDLHSQLPHFLMLYQDQVYTV